DWDAANLKEDKIKSLDTYANIIKRSHIELKKKEPAQKNLERLELIQLDLDKTPEEITKLTSIQNNLRQESADLNSKRDSADALLESEHRAKIAEFDKKIQGYEDGVFWERNSLNYQNEKRGNKRGNGLQGTLFK
ncbi:MAG: hypothetical protein IIC66_01560, partial [candidate division Zixibacteria bacterium]|nr:hypothetical protein [candidate division Zixibacteria bacterium]